MTAFLSRQKTYFDDYDKAKSLAQKEAREVAQGAMLWLKELLLVMYLFK